MTRVRALVVSGFGINCEEETAAAYGLAGAAAEVVHLGRVLRGEVGFGAYDIVHLPGGFSFGDDLGAGRVLAARIRSRALPSGATMLDELAAVAGRGGVVVGVCNGFQVLVELGLLPNVGGERAREAALVRNDSGKYEDRWVRLRSNRSSPVAVWEGLEQWEVPVRHGQGRLLFRDDAVRGEVERRGLNCLTYCDEGGRTAWTFPANPNGSELACAALCDPEGGVLGMMPHPEAFLSFVNHYDWAGRRRRGEDEDEADGLRFFRNVVRCVAERTA